MSQNLYSLRGKDTERYIIATLLLTNKLVSDYTSRFVGAASSQSHLWN